MLAAAVFGDFEEFAFARRFSEVHSSRQSTDDDMAIANQGGGNEESKTCGDLKQIRC